MKLYLLYRPANSVQPGEMQCCAVHAESEKQARCIAAAWAETEGTYIWLAEALVRPLGDPIDLTLSMVARHVHPTATEGESALEASE